MSEIKNNSIHLVVTSPPYYNAPFDYPNLFKNYNEFLDLLKKMAKELSRVLVEGRIACFVTDDMLVNGEKYPVVSDLTKIMMKNGFRYRDKIVWVKPKGYTRISRRSGVLLQHPYPMYFYPDNIQESILIFQKGKFDYKYLKALPKQILSSSKINLTEYIRSDWYLTVWNITNVLPLEGRLEEGIAAFPKEIPKRLIRLFTFVGETVLDPFAGSGTTLQVAKEFGRNSIGYEIDLDLEPVILEKLGYRYGSLSDDKIDIVKRRDAKKMRSHLQEGIKRQKSITKSKVTESDIP